MASFRFLLHVLPGRFDPADILSRFEPAVPGGITRVRPILHEPLARVETVENGLLCRLPRLTNELYMSNTSADLSSDRSSFKKCVSVSQA